MKLIYLTYNGKTATLPRSVLKNIFTPVSTDNNKEIISYDANGNIQTYLRNGNIQGGSPLAMDNMTYHYKPNTNQLDHVTDAVPASNYSIDIDNQNVLNYTYDQIGNLTKDEAEGITEIKWNVYGKITDISKSDGTKINYTYDPAGNRISNTVNNKKTFYVRDANGNVMSVYTKDVGVNSGDLSRTETHLYGSSRLGMSTLITNVENPTATHGFETGLKIYEGVNHLGNVLITFSDKKIAIPKPSPYSEEIDYYVADVVGANDYYSFGMAMPGRTYSSSSLKYRYGFNGKEKDLETSSTTTYDYGFRIYNPALGRFLSVDPLTREYPWNSSYAFAENSPLEFIDIDGLEKFKVTMNLFIPFKTIPIAPAPPLIPGTITVKGDNRNLDASGTNPHNRVSVNFDIDVDNPAATQFQTNVTIGETKYFLEMPFVPDMTIWSGRAELGKEVNVNFTRSISSTETEITITINYSFKCKIPFPLRSIKYLDGINPAPAIDGSGNFTFTKNKKTGEVTFSQTHNVDGFPANEYVAKNLDNNIITPLLLFQPDDKTDAINLLPLVGDKTFESKNKTLVPGNSGKSAWGGAIPIMENDTNQKQTTPAKSPPKNKPLQVDRKL